MIKHRIDFVMIRFNILRITFAAVNFHSQANSAEPIYRTKAYIASNHRVSQLVCDDTRVVTVSGEDLQLINTTIKKLSEEIAK